MDPLFAPLPEDIASLSTDDLAALLDSYRDTARKLFDKDEKVVGGMTDAQILEAAQTGTELIGAVKAEIGNRAEQAEQAQAQLAELRAAAGVDDEGEPVEGDPEDENAEPAEEPVEDPAEPVEEPESEEEPEEEGAEALPVAAAATPLVKPTGRAKAKPAAKQKGGFRPRARLSLVEGVAGTRPGTPITEISELREAMVNVQESVVGSSGRQEDIKVARFRIDRPAAYVLDRNGEENSRKITAAVDLAKRGYPEQDLPIAASGALCAPVAPYYELETLGIADRPVRDALVSFEAARGGIQFATPFDLSAITTGVGIITAAQAATGGTPAVKSCQAVTCPSFTTVKVDAIYSCLQFDNLNSRAFPEFVDAANTEAANAWARLADSHLLDLIRAQCKTVIAGQVLGAFADLSKHFIVAAAGYRSRHRMAADAPLKVLAPQWLPDMLLADTFRTQFNRFDFTRDTIAAELEKANIQLSYYADTSAAASHAQVFASQSGSGAALLGFPVTMEWFMFSPGAFLHVDSGELDLGIVRDSTLNSTNDYRVFMESWEQVAFTGVEALCCTSTLCDTGAVSLPIAAACDSGGHE